MNYKFLFINILMYLCLSQKVLANDKQEMLQVIKDFYSWSLSNSTKVRELEPHFNYIRDTNRFFLNMTNIELFTNSFISSGFFAPAFSKIVFKYYDKYRKEVEKYDQSYFDNYEKYGAEIIMGSEDTDIFLCTQDYISIDKIQIKSASIKNSKAKIVIEIPEEQYETEFNFSKINNKWLISQYCLYKNY